MLNSLNTYFKTVKFSYCTVYKCSNFTVFYHVPMHMGGLFKSAGVILSLKLMIFRLGLCDPHGNVFPINF